MIIALFPNVTKVNSQEIASQIRKFLVDRHVIIAPEDDKAAAVGAIPNVVKIREFGVRVTGHRFHSH